jgi:predicted nuclease of predicted toxin-antitoxin system
LQGKSDDKILAAAKREKRILVTFDLDFSNIINYPPGSHPGIIVVRLDVPSKKTIVQAIVQFVKTAKLEDIARSLVILEDKNYRIRK